jgi:hypothetical protein
MQICAGIEMQVETDNYRPRKLFYHHNFHTNWCFSRHSVQNDTASLPAQPSTPCAPHFFPQTYRQQPLTVVHIIPSLQNIGSLYVIVMWHILGGRITFLYEKCKCDVSVCRVTGYELGCQVAVFGFRYGVGIISSLSWTSKLWSTFSHIMGAADSSPDDKGGYSPKLVIQLNVMPSWHWSCSESILLTLVTTKLEVLHKICPRP